MAWTKRQFIVKAFGAIGLASYAFDLQPEQLQDALSSLDGMMAAWNARGVRLSYPLSSSPNTSDIDVSSGVPDSANEAVYANLAIRLASGLGKTPSPELKTIAKQALDGLMARAAQPPKLLLNALPAGAGAKATPGTSEFLSDPEDPLVAGPDSELEFD